MKGFLNRLRPKKEEQAREPLPEESASSPED